MAESPRRERGFRLRLLWDSLDAALAGCIAYKHEGPNHRADVYFIRVIEKQAQILDELAALGKDGMTSEADDQPLPCGCTADKLCGEAQALRLEDAETLEQYRQVSTPFGLLRDETRKAWDEHLVAFRAYHGHRYPYHAPSPPKSKKGDIVSQIEAQVEEQCGMK